LALSIVHGVFAFIVVGLMKVLPYEKYKSLTEKNGATEIGRGLAAFISIAELAGGPGIILPMATNIAPWLTTWAAVRLSAIMVLAIGSSPQGVAHLFLPGNVWCTGGVLSLSYGC
jgi:hypothetical protein